MKTFGADVSHWEGDVDWIKGVDYLPFVYYKATDGEDFIDSQFGGNQDECDEVGMPHAPYHWWQELENPEIQADFFVETTQGTYKKRIVDVEPRVYFAGIVDKLERHLHRIEDRQGFKPTIYTSKNYWNTFIKPCPPWASEYEFIVAQYAYKLTLIPAYVTKVIGWQFTDEFYFSGCNAVADGNWFNGTLDECRNWFGNYHPYNPQPSSGKFEMRVSAGTLNIRSGPSINYPIVGTLSKGDIVAVSDIAGQDAWIKHEKGWSCCKVGGYKYLFPKELNVYGYQPEI